MKLMGAVQLVASIALFVFCSSLYFWLQFCFEPDAFRFPAPPGDCYLVNTPQPHVGLVFGFFTSAVVTASTFVSAVGFFAGRPWAPRLSAFAALGGACAFVVLGSLASGLLMEYYVVAALLIASLGILRLRLGPNKGFNATARKRAAR